MAPPPREVHLRPTTREDLPALFEIQSDPDANALAGTKPRDLRTFMTRWDAIFKDQRIVPRSIIADGVLVGSINIFQQDGVDCIGYWLAREHWGRGIATRAIGLLLGEVPARPLTAHVVSHNEASLRALRRHGFTERGRDVTAETERYTGAETVTLVLE